MREDLGGRQSHLLPPPQGDSRKSRGVSGSTRLCRRKTRFLAYEYLHVYFMS